VSALGHKQTLTTCLVAPLLQASAAFRWAPLFCGVGDIVRAWIAKAAIASQNITSAVAVLERAILAIPIRATFAEFDHRAPWGLVSLSRWTEGHSSKSSNSSNGQAHHRDLNPWTLVITPTGLSLFAADIIIFRVMST
jgi:hypothetical protein